jgi:hypothetical protein
LRAFNLPEAELVVASERIDEFYRRPYIATLKPVFEDVLSIWSSWMNSRPVISGLGRDKPLQDVLNTQLSGATRSYTKRVHNDADLRLIKGMNTAEVLSRARAKLVVALSRLRRVILLKGVDVQQVVFFG